MARKKRRTSPNRKQKRLILSTQPETTDENENQSLNFTPPHHYLMNPGAGMPSHRSDLHYTYQVKQRD
jgi:hypothetical protein